MEEEFKGGGQEKLELKEKFWEAKALVWEGAEAAPLGATSSSSTIIGM